MVELDSVAEQLYRLDPGDFTAARDGRAADARRAGQPDLAAAIKRLRRPSSAAWAINLLAREQAGGLDELLLIGARLRGAQAALSVDSLRSLGHRRQQVVTSLARQATALTRDRRQPLSESAQREVRATLEAAAADPDAGAAVRSGRLVQALEYSGFGPLDLATALGGQRMPSGPAEPTEAPRDPAVIDAELGRAEDALERAGRTAEQAVSRADQAAETVRQLEEGVNRARESADAAAQAVREATEQVDLARKEVEAIRDRRRLLSHAQE